MCGIRELGFGDDCAGVRLHEVRTCAGKVEEIAMVAVPTVADLVLGAQEQR